MVRGQPEGRSRGTLVPWAVREQHAGELGEDTGQGERGLAVCRKVRLLDWVDRVEKGEGG